MANRIMVRWVGDGPKPQRGWWATFPSGRRRRWNYNAGLTFSGWIMGFLRSSGDVVEVHYPKTILTYRVDSRKAGE